MASVNGGTTDPTIQRIMDELRKVRVDLLAEITEKMDEDNLSSYTKKVRLEYLLQSFQKGLESVPGGQVTIGPSLVSDKKTVAYSVKRIVFPEPMWSGNALPRVPARKFFNDLRRIQQVAGERAALINAPWDAEDC